MKKIKISIIAPVYKIKKEVLKRSLSCMNNQDFEKDSYEIILVDDGSPDDCGRICDEFAHKRNNIKVIHTENRGVSHARNIGIINSVGEYLCFVDPDDYMYSTMLSSLYKIIVDYNAELVICNYKYGESHQKVSGEIYSFEEKKLNEIAATFIGGDTPLNTNITGAPWGKLYSKRIIEKNKCFFDESLPRSQDNEFNFRYIQLINKCVYIDEVLYQYNIGKNSAMRKYWPDAISNANTLLKKIEADIKLTGESEYYNKAFSQFVFGKIEDILYTNIVHPQNNDTISKKISILNSTLKQEIYKECLAKYKYSGRSFYRKILCFFLKHYCMICIYIISKLRILIKNRG